MLNQIWHEIGMLSGLLFIADFLVDKLCRPQKPLLIYALYLNVNMVNDYF